MKREIKFRGYSRRHKEWGYGSIDILNDGSAEIYGKSYIMEVDRNTIGQYIGRKDRNGKEVYEGDILETSDYRSRFIIEWDAENLRFVGVNVADLPMRGLTDIYQLIHPKWWQTFLPKIVGNIYDNPELIKDYEKE